MGVLAGNAARPIVASRGHAVQHAMVQALRLWPVVRHARQADRVAHFRSRNHLARRVARTHASRRRGRSRTATGLRRPSSAQTSAPETDDRLALIFACLRPELPAASRWRSRSRSRADSACADRLRDCSPTRRRSRSVSRRFAQILASLGARRSRCRRGGTCRRGGWATDETRSIFFSEGLQRRQRR